MSVLNGWLWNAARAAAAGLLLLALASVAEAGKKKEVAVGGVYVEPDGLVREPTVDETGRLRRDRLNAMQPVGSSAAVSTGLRMISLGRLNEAMAEQQRKIAPLSDEMKYLAGLQRVQYVFVYPEQNDIVLAGPGEGWKVHDDGFVVGQTTGRPVLLLDDLLVALRTAEAAAQGALSCSIDPTPAGIAALHEFLKGQRQMGPGVVEGIEQALGMQTITVRGVPATSHFARVLVSADYRMKRLAMAIDKAPVPGMPSYMQLVSTRSKDVMPRWWLTTNYDSLLKDPEGLAWEIRGPGVKAMTEDEILAATGQRTRTGEANPVAQKWADTMTEKYDELSVKDPIFGELRNVMDLAVVGALMAKERLLEKAGCELPLLMNDDGWGVETLTAPTQVPSTASVAKKGRGWVISASGGVEIPSWRATEQVEIGPDMAGTREQAAPREQAAWWWNG